MTGGYKLAYVAATAAVVIAAGIVWLAPWREGVAPARPGRMAYPLPDRLSIAVLPLERDTRDTGMRRFAIDIGEKVITSLSRMPQVFVMTAEASAAYLGRTVDPGQAAEELGVRYILLGGIPEPKEEGDEAVLEIALIDTLEGVYLRREEFELEAQGHLNLRDRVIDAVLDALEVELPAKEKARILRRDMGGRNISAFLRGSWSDWFKFENELNQTVIAHTKTWLERKPGNPALLVQQAWGYWAKLAFGWHYGLAGNYKRMADAADKALAASPDYAPALAIHGVAEWWGKAYESAFRACDSAMALAPSNADIAFDCGMIYLLAGRLDDAMAQTMRGFRLNPRAPMIRYDTLSEIHRVRGESAEMREAAQRVTEQEGNFEFTIAAHLRLIVADWEAGDPAAAKKRLAMIRERARDYPLENFRRRFRYRDPAIMEKFFAALEAVQAAP